MKNYANLLIHHGLGIGSKHESVFSVICPYRLVFAVELGIYF